MFLAQAAPEIPLWLNSGVLGVLAMVLYVVFNKIWAEVRDLRIEIQKMREEYFKLLERNTERTGRIAEALFLFRMRDAPDSDLMAEHEKLTQHDQP